MMNEGKMQELFLAFGYSVDEYKKLRNTPLLLEKNKDLDYQKVLEMFSYLLNIGCSKSEIKKITKINVYIFNLDKNQIENKVNYLLDIGYEKDDISKMIACFPYFLSFFDIQKIENRIKELVMIGYTKENILKMTKKLPQIYSYTTKTIKDKVNDLMMLGYTKENIIKMTIIHPEILSYSIENIKQKLYDIIMLGYTKEDVLKMTTELPTLYGLNIDNIKQKIDFYNLINLHDMPVASPKYLMQSVYLSYARYMFFKSIGVNINMKSYAKMFNSQKAFKDVYKVSNEELLNRYRYDIFMEEKNEKSL